MIQFTTSPAGAAVAMPCVDGKDDVVIALSFGGGIDRGRVRLTRGWWGQAGEIPAVDGALTIGVEACGDMSGFNDEMVTFSFVATSLKGAPAGLATSPPVLIWWSRCGA